MTHLQPASFPIFQKDSNTTLSTMTFSPEGKAEFDDFGPVDVQERHETNTIKYEIYPFPADFVNLDKEIPKNRTSAEEEYAVRGASLPEFQPISPTKVYKLPLKIPNHHFISDHPEIRRYQKYIDGD